MKKILMVLFTACLFIAGKPGDTPLKALANKSNFIIREWQIIRTASDANTYVITGDFNLTTQTFGNVITAHKVGIPWPEYSCSLSSSVDGVTWGTPATYIDIQVGGTLTIGSTVTYTVCDCENFPLL